MQLTPDCIRDVLLELETFHMGAYKADEFQNRNMWNWIP